VLAGQYRSFTPLLLAGHILAPAHHLAPALSEVGVYKEVSPRAVVALQANGKPARTASALGNSNKVIRLSVT
jgi:hypothetical protein